MTRQTPAQPTELRQFRHQMYIQATTAHAAQLSRTAEQLLAMAHAGDWDTAAALAWSLVETSTKLFSLTSRRVADGQ